jgi:pimeloyl-ACP methyl ester carboxylesterase
MKIAKINGVELEYEETGSGEPVLLVSPVLADGFLPFTADARLTGRYRMIRYHRRGWCGSTHTPAPVRIEDHATDAAELLGLLGVRRAHLLGHSSGGTICLQLALDRPGLVHTLGLFEPTLLSVPAAAGFFEKVGPALQAYSAGEHDKAVAIFLSAASGLGWDHCRTLLEKHAPGTSASAVRDADTFFGIELPSLGAWNFTREQAVAISQPVLSVLGAETEPLWVEVAALLRSWLPRVEDRTVDGVGHLLHLQSPAQVIGLVAEFLMRHPLEQRETSSAPQGTRLQHRSDRASRGAATTWNPTAPQRARLRAEM